MLLQPVSTNLFRERSNRRRKARSFRSERFRAEKDAHCATFVLVCPGGDQPDSSTIDENPAMIVGSGESTRSCQTYCARGAPAWFTGKRDASGHTRPASTPAT